MKRAGNGVRKGGRSVEKERGAAERDPKRGRMRAGVAGETERRTGKGKEKEEKEGAGRKRKKEGRWRRQVLASNAFGLPFC